MSPVCKKCRNYVMNFPCPHCGGDLALTDRKSDEINHIIPLDLQESFKEPPPPVSKAEASNIPSYIQPASPQPKSHTAHAQTHHIPPASVTPPLTEPLKTPFSATALESSPSPPPPIEGPLQTPPPSIAQKADQAPPPAPPIPSVIVSKDNSVTTIPIEDINEHFKQLESHLKEIDSRQKQYESQAEKFKSNFKKIDKKIKKINDSLKILLKTNKKLESIHKITSKDLKKTL